jgi:hypothetical protein
MKQSHSTSMDILKFYTISNAKLVNYKVLGLVELYNFDINFVLIWEHMKKLRIFLAQDHFQEWVMSLPAPHLEMIFRCGWPHHTHLEMRIFSGASHGVTRTWKWFPDAGDGVTRSLKWFLGAGLSTTVSRVFLRSDGETSRSWKNHWLLEMFSVVVLAAGRSLAVVNFAFPCLFFAFFVLVFLTHGNYVLLSGSWEKKLIFVLSSPRWVKHPTTDTLYIGADLEKVIGTLFLSL